MSQAQIDSSQSHAACTSPLLHIYAHGWHRRVLAVCARVGMHMLWMSMCVCGVHVVQRVQRVHAIHVVGVKYVYACLYVCHVLMYVCMYVCMYVMYVCHVCMHVCMYVCMLCMYVCVCACALVKDDFWDAFDEPTTNGNGNITCMCMYMSCHVYYVLCMVWRLWCHV